jgi:hypothetical protein
VWNIWVSIILFFSLKIIFSCKWQGHIVCDTSPCFIYPSRSRSLSPWPFWTRCFFIWNYKLFIFTICMLVNIVLWTNNFFQI